MPRPIAMRETAGTAAAAIAKEVAMATTTRSVTINAAFLQEIKEDNQELKQLLAICGQLFSRRPGKRLEPRATVDLLSRLRDQLALHFALEEAYGYFEDALEVAPRLSQWADSLRNEHGELFLEICDLEEQAERWLYHESPSDGQRRLAARYRQFEARFRAHESKENDFILQSLNLDIGVGD
jgi:hemerythrin-like domain-containing protein